VKIVVALAERARHGFGLIDFVCFFVSRAGCQHTAAREG